ncbi:MAG: cyclase family protein [Candidatus Lutacidiplasmatales archaeon]
MRTIDISMPMHPGMPSFPGDPPVHGRPVRQVDRGDPYNLSVWTMGSHAGTHVDPPRHFLSAGAGSDRLDLAVLNGPCHVVDVGDGATTVGPAEVARMPSGTTRVLFRSANSRRWDSGDQFFPDYVALTLPAANELLARGVRLVGVDALSIESDPSERYPVHRLLLGAGVAILEGLRLGAAPAGEYELRCLPLRWVDGDGAPCRAVLVAA